MLSLYTVRGSDRTSVPLKRWRSLVPLRGIQNSKFKIQALLIGKALRIL